MTRDRLTWALVTILCGSWSCHARTTTGSETSAAATVERRHEGEDGGAGPPVAASQPEAPRPTITIRLEASSDRPLYASIPEAWANELTLERRVGEEWRPVVYELPTCARDCPAAGEAADCSPCQPAAPLPRVYQLPTEYQWWGAVYELQSGGPCECHRALPVPPGTYRVSMCAHTEHACLDDPPCPPDDHGMIAGTGGGERVCARSELELTGADQVVTLRFDR